MKRLCLLMGGCVWLASWAALWAQDVARGEQLYRGYCAACHGPKGEGARGADLTAPRLVHAPDAEALLRVIRFGIPGTEMPGTMNILNEPELRDVVAFVGTLQRKVPPAASGNAARGEQLYRKNDCARCHAIGGEGGVLGPDLTDIGARRGPSHLRAALVEPEAYIAENFGQYRWYITVPDNFLQVRVVTRAGRKITGARLNEDAFSIQVRDLSGRVHSFWKSDLRELHKDWGKSPMPSYKDALSAAELDDLVAYLVSLRGGR